MPKSLKGEGKVSRHSRTYKGHKLHTPRISITSQKLSDYGLDIGAQYEYILRETEDGPELIIKPK